jgi:DNA-binding response OmpR family regulator
VEDDPTVRRSIRLACEKEGFRVQEASIGTEALERAALERPDLVLLDLMLPGMNGYDVCRELRHLDAELPIIMVTAKGEEVDKVIGLELGADDYVTKPFGPRELIARIRAHLRKRSRQGGEPADGPSALRPSLRIGQLLIRVAEREVAVADQPVSLTHTEFEILNFLARHAGQVLTRDQIVTQVWGYDAEGDGRLLDSHIKNLRRKIEPDARRPRFIVTVQQVGYKLVREPPPG